MNETEQETLRRNNKSGATGVSWDARRQSFQVRYTHKNTPYFLGYYKSLDYASTVYQEFKKRMEQDK